MYSCWVCNNQCETLSKEHLIKQTDLKQAFSREVTQKSPLYLHQNGGRSNIPVGSIPKNKMLKSNAPMCSKCNNERTQVHDRSWAMLSEHLASQTKILPKSVKLADVFGNSDCCMKGVQLYFAKNLGCRIVDSKAKFDLSPLAESILNNKACDNLFLSIGFVKKEGNFLGGSNLRHVELNNNTLAWKYVYGAGKFFVDVTYSVIEPKADLSFNPRRTSNILSLIELK